MKYEEGESYPILTEPAELYVLVEGADRSDKAAMDMLVGVAEQILLSRATGIKRTKFNVPVTDENIDIVRDAAANTLQIGGFKGVKLILEGTKRAAIKILDKTKSPLDI